MGKQFKQYHKKAKKWVAQSRQLFGRFRKVCCCIGLVFAYASPPGWP